MLTLDLDILQFVQSGIRSWLTPVMKTVSFVFMPEMFVPVVAIIFLFLILKNKRSQELLLLLILAGNILPLIMKPIVHRPRPTEPEAIVLDHQPDFSFPSSHAMAVMTTGGALVLLAHHRRRASWWLIALTSGLVLLVGYSRVYLGAHWPTDVFGGYLLGWLWLWFVWGWVRPKLQHQG